MKKKEKILHKKYAPAIPKILSLALSWLMLLPLAGCNGGTSGGPSSATGSTTPHETTAAPGDKTGGFLGRAPLEDYTVIYNPASVYSIRGAHLIAAAIRESCGISLEIKPDTAAESPYEILVGDTSRAQSASVTSSADGYTAADADGKLVFRASSPAYLLKAAELFAADIAGGAIENFEKLPAGYTSSAAIDVKTLLGTEPTGRVERTEGADLRIMSFNILHENYNDKTPLSGRDSVVANIIAAYRPDVVGLEEVSEAWHDALNSIFRGSYAFIPDDVDGTGRSYSTIFYNTTAAELLDCGTKVYDAATNNYLRNLTWALFRRVSDGQEYIVTATHWDISSHEAERVLQAKENATLLTGLAAKYGVPIFSCGDYNRGEDTAEFTGFIRTTGMADSKLSAISAKRYGTVGATSHTLGAMPTTTVGTTGIDHIVYSKTAEILYFTSVTDAAALRVSDHCPIYADYKIGQTKTSDAPAKPCADCTPHFGLPDDPASVAKAPAGNGTADSPYLLSSAEELVWFRDEVCAGNGFAGQHLRLTADVDLGGREWLPAGSVGYPFSGTFDGDGHTVSGMRITRAAQNTGFFGFATSYVGVLCEIKNVKISGSIELDDLQGNLPVGGIAGNLGSAVRAARKTKLTSVVSDVAITVKSTKGEPRIGGFGGNISAAILTDCAFTGSIRANYTAAARVGGYAGQIYASEFLRCTNSGSLIASSANASAYVGGFCGIASYSDVAASKFENCVNTGSVSSESSAVSAFSGGFVGHAYSAGTDVNLKILSCLNSGSITAKVLGGTKLAYGGGIIGYCNKKQVTVDGCVNTASLISAASPSGTREGGIVGVFNLSDDGGTLVVKNCTTVGALAGYFKGTQSDNKANASAQDTEAKAAEILSKIGS